MALIVKFLPGWRARRAKIESPITAGKFEGTVPMTDTRGAE